MNSNTAPGKEKMLERVRKALGHSSSSTRIPSHVLPETGRVLPPIPSSKLVDHFEAELRAVAGTPHRASSAIQFRQILLEILGDPQAAPIVLSRNPLLAAMRLAGTLGAMGFSVVQWPGSAAVSPDDWAAFRRQCFSAPAGITGVDFALAESGTLILTSETEGSQLVSLAPPIHIALYTRAQVVESLEEVLAQQPRQPDASREPAGRSVVFITGSSRTADIEQISVRGVHGPLQMHAILLEGDVCGKPQGALS
jgi:L-lactate dehydrogenase complex protein LldG